MENAISCAQASKQRWDSGPCGTSCVIYHLMSALLLARSVDHRVIQRVLSAFDVMPVPDVLVDDDGRVVPVSHRCGPVAGA